LRGGGKAACWRVAGASAVAAGGRAATTGAVFLAAVFARFLAAGSVLGTTLRAIGLGFGNGTFLGLAQASPLNADNPTASARHVAKAVDKAVDRNAAGRLDGVTAFFRGESFNR
jgi:hypothetical protein